MTNEPSPAKFTHYEIWNIHTKEPDWNGRFQYLTAEDAIASLVSDPLLSPSVHHPYYWGKFYKIIAVTEIDGDPHLHLDRDDIR